MNKLPVATQKQPQTPADKWLKLGLQAAESFVESFRKTKSSALTAGLMFWHAREAVKQGEFSEYLKAAGLEAKERSIFRFIEFVEEVAAWSRKQNPKINDIEKLIEIATPMVLASPKGYIALCRELGEMRKFGEYDEVKYRNSKNGDKEPQIEFDFKSTTKTFEMLEKQFSSTVSIAPEQIPALEQHIARLSALVAELKAKAGAILADSDADGSGLKTYVGVLYKGNDKLVVELQDDNVLADIRADKSVVWLTPDIIAKTDIEALEEATLRQEQNMGEFTWAGKQIEE